MHREYHPSKYKEPSGKVISNSPATQLHAEPHHISQGNVRTPATRLYVEPRIPQGNVRTLMGAGSLTPMPDLFRR